MESVICDDDLRKTDQAQWEIHVVTDENENETKTMQSEAPPSTSAPPRRRSRGRSKSKKSKRAKRRGNGYAFQSVEMEMEAVERETGDRDTLGVAALNFPAFASSVSPPSKELSILNGKISVKDVRPAFYVPGMNSLSSMPIPPQPRQDRLAMLGKPKPRENERQREEVDSVAPSSAVSALSEVTASTHCLNSQRRKDTNLSAAWNECASEREMSAVSGTSVDL